MQRSGTLYTFLFAGAVCVVCSVFVSTAAVSLKERQQRNVVLDRQEQVLRVAGLVEQGEAPPAEKVRTLFEENIEMHYVDLETGEYADDQVEELKGPYDPVKAATSEELGMGAPANRAQVKRLPKYAAVYQYVENDTPKMVILQVWGKGLWSTMYGYLALDTDGKTIRGLTFYEHGETPGLGGEIDNPRWKSQWVGRKAFDETGEPAVQVVKSGAGSVEQTPHKVDSISGATITSNGVQYLINFWLSEEVYGPYLDRFQEEISQAA